MNTSNVKKYAPKARKAFIEAMNKQAAKYGITKKKIEPAEQKGDLVLIGDRPFPAPVIKPRERLVKRIEHQGFDQVMEHVAYSWFNRLCAIRYMERKGFLDHGRRVLSAADGSAGVPQILEECLDVELLGLDQDKVRELKLDGTKDEELYRELLLAQCHALHQAMPFLFEAVADESELLLPENLTKTDSLIRELVASVPDEDWDHIEIIGWLYQFYISEKKDQVMGKVVKSEDIPAATQLFTPNWIVQYLVQNSVGRQWLQTYRDSPLKEKMPYYIEPAEQTPEVQAELAAIIPKDLKPETLSCIDPAVGSGHLLIEAYKVFKAIYEERGYRTRDIPQLILENNLFGLDIDDRAGQLAGFALMMLAREDDRRIFSRNIRLNVLSLQESSNVNLPSLWRSLNLTGEWQSGTSQGLFEEEQQDLSAFTADSRYQLLQRTLERFKQAKTFGSLIDVPNEDYEGIKELLVSLCELENAGDPMQKSAAIHLIPYVHQAAILAQKYDMVVANPPYMGGKWMSGEVKKFISRSYPDSSSDLYSAFLEKGFSLCNRTGINSQVTLQTWMFLSGFSELREKIVSDKQILSLMHIGYNSFPELNSKIVQCSVLVATNNRTTGQTGIYLDLNRYPQSSNKAEIFFNARIDRSYCLDQQKFLDIPGHPIAYWISEVLRRSFSGASTIEDISPVRQGFQTGDNDRFLRFWHEIDVSKFMKNATSKEHLWESKKKWVPYNKGGGFRRWYGNNEYVVAFDEENYNSLSRMGNCLPSKHLYFKESITWSSLTSSHFGARYSPQGFTFSAKGACAFPNSKEDLSVVCVLLNSEIARKCLEFLAPTLDFNVGDIRRIPISVDADLKAAIHKNFMEILSVVREDWDSFEISWDFKKNPLLQNNEDLISSAFSKYAEQSDVCTKDVFSLELENNRLLAESYGMLGEIEEPIQDDSISINRNPKYRYGKDFNEDDLCVRFRSDTLSELISYSIGCLMGRYSLSQEGLVYAHKGTQGFHALIADGKYKSFTVDDDAIIPLTDQEWFPDDATNRFSDFVKVVWGEEHLHENLDFVAESLCLHAIKPKKSESSMDTIRRYLSTQFYKDHLKTYKKRPIYWLFSSGKQKAFECLVYLHRYNEGTLARMRTEYVIPLTAKMAAYAQKLENDKEASGSAAEVKRLEKEIAQLHKQQAELSEFDEKLRHYADQRISLDLDDGVKVNYGKFGDLLAEVKAITGEAPEALS
tara:strand:- start:3183 stop:6845 length:3663 start_codon:yes stop_codon:yes gene_type:complete